MCEHFLAAPLSSCGKVFADAAACEAECYDHVTTLQSNGMPSADEGDLDCAIAASTCETWDACGDLL